MRPFSTVWYYILVLLQLLDFQFPVLHLGRFKQLEAVWPLKLVLLSHFEYQSGLNAVVMLEVAGQLVLLAEVGHEQEALVLGGEVEEHLEHYEAKGKDVYFIVIVLVSF